MQNEYTYPGDNIWLDARIPSLQFHAVAGQEITVRHVYQRERYLGRLQLVGIQPGDTVEYFTLVHDRRDLYCVWEPEVDLITTELRDLIVLIPRVYDGARAVLKLTHHNRPKKG